MSRDTREVAKASAGGTTQDHSGIVRMKAIARCYIWLEGVDKNIESVVKSCQACQTVKNSPPNAPLHLVSRARPFFLMHAKGALKKGLIK